MMQDYLIELHEGENLLAITKVHASYNAAQLISWSMAQAQYAHMQAGAEIRAVITEASDA